MEGYVVPLDKSKLESAPRYAETEVPDYNDEYGKRVHDYYGVNW